MQCGQRQQSSEPDVGVSRGVEIRGGGSRDDLAGLSVLGDASVVAGVVELRSVVIDVCHKHCHRRRARQRREACTQAQQVNTVQQNIR